MLETQYQEDAPVSPCNTSIPISRTNMILSYLLKCCCFKHTRSRKVRLMFMHRNSRYTFHTHAEKNVRRDALFNHTKQFGLYANFPISLAERIPGHSQTYFYFCLCFHQSAPLPAPSSVSNDPALQQFPKSFVPDLVV